MVTIAAVMVWRGEPRASFPRPFAAFLLQQSPSPKLRTVIVPCLRWCHQPPLFRMVGGTLRSQKAHLDEDGARTAKYNLELIAEVREIPATDVELHYRVDDQLHYRVDDPIGRGWRGCAVSPQQRRNCFQYRRRSQSSMDVRRSYLLVSSASGSPGGETCLCAGIKTRSRWQNKFLLSRAYPVNSN